MPDFLTSLCRTWASDIVGALVGLALTVGIVVPADLSTEATVALAGLLVVGAQMLWYAAVRALEQRWPGAGRLLLAARPPYYKAEELPVHFRTVMHNSLTEAEIDALTERVREIVRREIDLAPRRRM